MDGQPPGAPRRVAYLYVLPALLVFGAFFLVPFGHTIWIALHRWDGVGAARWVGVANFRALAADATVRSSFLHAFVLVLFYAVLPVVLGLVLAEALSRRSPRSGRAFQAIAFLPQVATAVAVGAVWRWLYAADGPLDGVLRAVGLGGLARAWLADFTLALPAVGLVATWTFFGLVATLALAGMRRVPQSLYDAAAVDGAGRARAFLGVTLPGIRNELAVAMALGVVAAVRTFDVVFVTTGGGPGSQTTVPTLLLYERAFQFGAVGAAAALGVAAAAILLPLTYAIARLFQTETA